MGHVRRFVPELLPIRAYFSRADGVTGFRAPVLK